jgi:hypothetical protein
MSTAIKQFARFRSNDQLSVPFGPLLLCVKHYPSRETVDLILVRLRLTAKQKIIPHVTPLLETWE